MSNEKMNDQKHGNDYCAVTQITDNYTTMCNNHSQDLSINDRHDKNEHRSSNSINVHSFDLVIPPIVMMEEHEI
jgi:hypothetical protein